PPRITSRTERPPLTSRKWLEYDWCLQQTYRALDSRERPVEVTAVARSLFARSAAAAALLGAFLAGCAPAPSAPSSGAAPSASAPTSQAVSGPSGTLRIAWGAEPPLVAAKFLNGGSSALTELANTFNSALTYQDPSGAPHPEIASEIPSQDAGTWVVNPDGTMVTTYHLHENARWHDGQPLTADDFVF